MEIELTNLSEFELVEIEGGSITIFAIACCSIAFATGLATALMIL